MKSQIFALFVAFVVLQQVLVDANGCISEMNRNEVVKVAERVGMKNLDEILDLDDLINSKMLDEGHEFEYTTDEIAKALAQNLSDFTGSKFNREYSRIKDVCSTFVVGLTKSRWIEEAEKKKECFNESHKLVKQYVRQIRFCRVIVGNSKLQTEAKHLIMAYKL